MVFSQEWIKNVAKISNNLNDTDKLYKLYGDLEMIGKAVENRRYGLHRNTLPDNIFLKKRYVDLINGISSKAFKKKFLNGDFENIMIIKILNLILVKKLFENKRHNRKS